MNVIVNERPREVADGATVASVVAAEGFDPERPGVAVAVDGEVLPRTRWHEPLTEGARVELVGASQGG